MPLSHVLLGSSLMGLALGQQAGRKTANRPLPLSLHACTAGGCRAEQTWANLDANWRWFHDGDTNCFTNGAWDARLCSDPDICARQCAVDGVDAHTYATTYGIRQIPGGLQLAFQTGTNMGSRLYLMDGAHTYKLFGLKNREIAFDVDVSTLGCGVNAALYLISMNARGGQGLGGNGAGAAYGTGYCDAQCPHDVKFINGRANLNGALGSCCMEIDLFEGNREAEQFAAHTCDFAGPAACEGHSCGETSKREHYTGICDKDGCDFNSFRMGAKDFYGHRGATAINSLQPFTVVTQFITVDGTDSGELAGIKRVYVQNGRVFQNSNSAYRTAPGNAMDNRFCSNLKRTFAHTRAANNPTGNFDQFNEKGGMAKIGEALERGMVLALSIWDDSETDMRWLDSVAPMGLPLNTPGVVRGMCRAGISTAQIRQEAADSYVNYANIRYGTIGSTTSTRWTRPSLKYDDSAKEKEDMAIAEPRSSSASAVPAVLLAATGATAAMAVTTMIARAVKTGAKMQPSTPLQDEDAIAVATTHSPGE